MAKPLPPDDFRAIRIVCEPDDFAIGSEEPDPPPSDMIPKETWEHLVSLPDDVSVRTSNYFGTVLKNLSEMQNEFVCIGLAIQESVADVSHSPIGHASSVACDEFQSSIYSALTGYYRLAFTALRSVVENMAVGMQLELSSDQIRFQQWLSGEELGLGWAADLAPRTVRAGLGNAPTGGRRDQVVRESTGGILVSALGRGARSCKTYNLNASLIVSLTCLTCSGSMTKPTIISNQPRCDLTHLESKWLSWSNRSSKSLQRLTGQLQQINMLPT